MPWRKQKIHIGNSWFPEIMLQHTQVVRGGKILWTFLRRFPDFRSLARSDRGDVCAHGVWAGYTAARFHCGGSLSRSPKNMWSMPVPSGCARNTGDRKATAVPLWLRFQYAGARFIETNIRRVFIHSSFQGGKKWGDARLCRSGADTDRGNPHEWYGR